MRNGIAELLLVVALASLLVFGFYVMVKGEGNTTHRPPTVNELITQMRVEIMSDLAGAMIQANQLAKLEMAAEFPCAEMQVSSKTINGRVYYGLEATFEECLNGDSSGRDIK